jgi:hypothetical protein
VLFQRKFCFLFLTVSQTSMTPFRVQQLAKKIGEELWNVGEAITKRSEVQEVEKKCFILEHALLGFRANVVCEEYTVTSRAYLGEEDMNE